MYMLTFDSRLTLAIVFLHVYSPQHKLNRLRLLI